MVQKAELARQLKNVGPALAAKMIKAGIKSPEKLRKLGARQAFDAMYLDGDNYGDFNAAYLYALEGAIRDCGWAEIPSEVKKAHKDYAHALQKSKRAQKQKR